MTRLSDLFSGIGMSKNKRVKFVGFSFGPERKDIDKNFAIETVQWNLKY